MDFSPRKTAQSGSNAKLVTSATVRLDISSNVEIFLDIFGPQAPELLDSDTCDSLVTRSSQRPVEIVSIRRCCDLTSALPSKSCIHLHGPYWFLISSRMHAEVSSCALALTFSLVSDHGFRHCTDFGNYFRHP